MAYFDRFRSILTVGLALRTVTVRVVDDAVVLEVDLDVPLFERAADWAAPRERPRPTSRLFRQGAVADRRPCIQGAGLLTHRIAAAAAPRPRPPGRSGTGLRSRVRLDRSGVPVLVPGAGRPWPGAGRSWSS